ncbi:MAG: flagellar export protein FliJ [Opitutaceae bacterium]
MKRFQFPLRSLARLRAHYELSAREAFAGAVLAHTHSEAEVAKASARVTELEAVVIAGRRGSFSAASETLNLGAYRSEQAGEATAVKNRHAARVQMERRRAEYIAAHQRLEVVKRLEERAHAAYRLDVNREEQAEFDDLAGRRAARKTVSAL